MFKKILVRKLGLCVVVSFFCAGTVFLLLKNISAYNIEKKYRDSDYVQAQMQKEIDTIQKYITENDVDIQHFYKIARWVDRDKITTISLYYEDRLIYDSTISYCAGTLSSGIKRKPLPWEKLYKIRFKDAVALMDLTVYLKHHDYDIALIRNLMVFFVVFLSLILFFVHHKTSYILDLEQQVQLMQGGKFDFPIQIKGDDEITSLAKNIDEMREIFIQQMQAQSKRQEASQKFVSTMTHDIKTPLAALIGYLDIVINKRSSDEQKLRKYLLKSAEKAAQLKSLTDHLFDHFVISQQQDLRTQDESNVDSVTLEYMVFDNVFLLESEGIDVKVLFADHIKYRIQIHREPLQRILDNVFSNILRYADKNEPVSVRLVPNGDNLTASFQNKVRSDIDSYQGTGLGLKSCQSILEKYHGSITAEETGDVYYITINIPIA